MKKIILVFFITLVYGLNAQSYLGYVTKTVNFRVEANTDSEVISSLNRGTALFVESKHLTNGFYLVLDIATDQEGFVHSGFVELDRELLKNTDGIFTPVGKTDSSNPIIKIHNNTEIRLTLKLNNDLYVFLPQQRKTLTLIAGSYEYRASAAGVLPDYGTEVMQGNYEYEWSFYISSQ
jgi:hypothetical protein|tara:strand:+ start:2535 stop:3068 length:534 start_codon:yes stop_codon:yes gene_type:complete